MKMNEPLFNATTTTGLHFASQTNNSVTQVLKIHHYYLFSKYKMHLKCILPLSLLAFVRFKELAKTCYFFLTLHDLNSTEVSSLEQGNRPAAYFLTTATRQ